MNNRLRVLALAMILPVSLGTACVSDDVGVSTSFDPLARFPATATYIWDEEESAMPQDERVANLAPILREVADEEFGKRGYRAVDSGPSDYRLSYLFRLNTTISAERSRSTGSLSLSLVDSKSNQLAWIGFGRAEIHIGLGREERRERLRRAFERMLKKFPPSQRGDQG